MQQVYDELLLDNKLNEEMQRMRESLKISEARRQSVKMSVGGETGAVNDIKILET
jgi:hypothetical protein